MTYPSQPNHKLKQWHALQVSEYLWLSGTNQAVERFVFEMQIQLPTHPLEFACSFFNVAIPTKHEGFTDEQHAFSIQEFLETCVSEAITTRDPSFHDLAGSILHKMIERMHVCPKFVDLAVTRANDSHVLQLVFQVDATGTVLPGDTKRNDDALVAGRHLMLTNSFDGFRRSDKKASFSSINSHLDSASASALSDIQAMIWKTAITPTPNSIPDLLYNILGDHTIDVVAKQIHDVQVIGIDNAYTESNSKQTQGDMCDDPVEDPILLACSVNTLNHQDAHKGFSLASSNDPYDLSCCGSCGIVAHPHENVWHVSNRQSKRRTRLRAVSRTIKSLVSRPAQQQQIVERLCTNAWAVRLLMWQDPTLQAIRESKNTPEIVDYVPEANDSNFQSPINAQPNYRMSIIESVWRLYDLVVPVGGMLTKTQLVRHLERWHFTEPERVELLQKMGKFPVPFERLDQVEEVVCAMRVSVFTNEGEEFLIDSESLRLVSSLFRGSCKVAGIPLAGGFSGTLVLRCESWDKHGAPQEQTVVKVGPADDILDEVERMRDAVQWLGESAPALLSFGVSGDSKDTPMDDVISEKDSVSNASEGDQMGAILIELCGASLTATSQYIGKDIKLIVTFKELYQLNIETEHGMTKKKNDNRLLDRPAYVDLQEVIGDVFMDILHVHGHTLSLCLWEEYAIGVRLDIALVSGLFAIPNYSPFSSISSSSSSSSSSSLSLPSVFSSEIRRMSCERAKLGRPETSPFMQNLLNAVGLERLDVHAALNDFVALTQLWGLTSEAHPVQVSFQHGDLNGANILVDGKGTCWIIDFASWDDQQHLLRDLSKLESCILFEYTPLHADATGDECSDDEYECESETDTHEAASAFVAIALTKNLAHAFMKSSIRVTEHEDEEGEEPEEEEEEEEEDDEEEEDEKEEDERKIGEKEAKEKEKRRKTRQKRCSSLDWELCAQFSQALAFAGPSVDALPRQPPALTYTSEKKRLPSAKWHLLWSCVHRMRSIAAQFTHEARGESNETRRSTTATEMSDVEEQTQTSTKSSQAMSFTLANLAHSLDCLRYQDLSREQKEWALCTALLHIAALLHHIICNGSLGTNNFGERFKHNLTDLSPALRLLLSVVPAHMNTNQSRSATDMPVDTTKDPHALDLNSLKREEEKYKRSLCLRHCYFTDSVTAEKFAMKDHRFCATWEEPDGESPDGDAEHNSQHEQEETDLPPSTFCSVEFLTKGSPEPLLVATPRLAIVGSRGRGKSLLLSHLVLAMAQGSVERESNQEHQHLEHDDLAPLPLFMTQHDLASKLAEFRTQELGKLDHRFLAFYINNKYGSESARSILLRQAANTGRLVLCCDNIIQAEKEGTEILKWLLYLSTDHSPPSRTSSTSTSTRRRYSQHRKSNLNQHNLMEAGPPIPFIISITLRDSFGFELRKSRVGLVHMEPLDHETQLSILRGRYGVSAITTPDSLPATLANLLCEPGLKDLCQEPLMLTLLHATVALQSANPVEVEDDAETLRTRLLENGLEIIIGPVVEEHLKVPRAASDSANEPNKYKSSRALLPNTAYTKRKNTQYSIHNEDRASYVTYIRLVLARLAWYARLQPGGLVTLGDVLGAAGFVRQRATAAHVLQEGHTRAHYESNTTSLNSGRSSVLSFNSHSSNNGTLDKVLLHNDACQAACLNAVLDAARSGRLTMIFPQANFRNNVSNEGQVRSSVVSGSSAGVPTASEEGFCFAQPFVVDYLATLEVCSQLNEVWLTEGRLDQCLLSTIGKGGSNLSTHAVLIRLLAKRSSRVLVQLKGLVTDLTSEYGEALVEAQKLCSSTSKRKRESIGLTTEKLSETQQWLFDAVSAAADTELEGCKWAHGKSKEARRLLHVLEQCVGFIRRSDDISVIQHNFWLVDGVIEALWQNKRGLCVSLVAQLIESCPECMVELARLSAQNGMILTLKILAEAGIQVNEPGTDGLNALVESAAGGHLRIVEFLVENGADIMSRCSEDKRTACYEACRRGRIHVVRYLISCNKKCVNAKKAKNYSPLMAACSHGKTQVVRYLLAHGAKVHVISQSGATPLYLAVKGGCPEVVQALLDHESNKDLDIDSYKICLTTGRHGKKFVLSLLLSTLKFGKTRIARLLLERGASANTTTVDGRSVLLMAVYYNRLRACMMLLEFGADVEIREPITGFTPLLLAAYMGWNQIVRWLIEEAGADTSAHCAMGTNALGAAVRGAGGKGSLRVAAYLLGRSDIVREQTPVSGHEAEGMRACCLEMAVDAGDCDMVRVLMNGGGYENAAQALLERVNALQDTDDALSGEEAQEMCDALKAAST